MEWKVQVSALKTVPHVFEPSMATVKNKVKKSFALEPTQISIHCYSRQVKKYNIKYFFFQEYVRIPMSECSSVRILCIILSGLKWWI